ncbi:MAG: hypothetical protein ABR578_00570 [Chromatocurvus sp.]
MALALQKGETPSPDVQSRLLPRLLGEKALSEAGYLRILDFGRANRLSLAFFGELSCRLQVLDASDDLVAKAREIRKQADEAQPASVTPDSFEALFPEIAGQRFDLILMWDAINLLPASALPAFLAFIGRHGHEHFRGHGFMLHKRNVESAVRHLGIIDASTLRVINVEPVTLYLHTRKSVNESLAPMAIDHGVLHSDGRAEFLFRGTTAS